MTTPIPTGTIDPIAEAVKQAFKERASKAGKAKWRKFNREARARGVSPKAARAELCGRTRREGHALKVARAKAQ